MEDPGLIPGICTVLVLALAGGMSLTLTYYHGGSLRLQMILFLCALTVRFLFSILVYEHGLVEVFKDEDAGGWVNGVTLAEMWHRQEVGVLEIPVAVFETDFLKYGENWGYYYLLGSFFYLTGTSSRLVAAALNCFMGAFTVVMVYRSASILLSQRVARVAGWLTCLWPSLIAWSGQTLKEPTVICLESLILYGCLVITVRGFSFRHFALCVFASAAVYPFRFYAGYLAALTVFITLLMLPLSRGRASSAILTRVAMLVGPILLIGFLFLAGREAHLNRSLQYAQTYRQDLAVGQGSGVVTNYDLGSPIGLAMATAVGAVHLLLAPFPWQLLEGSLRMLLTGPEVVSWYVVFFTGVLPGLRLTLRHRLLHALPLLLFIAGLGVVYSVTFGNVGLAYRQRAQLLPWLLILAVAGFEQRGWLGGVRSRQSVRSLPRTASGRIAGAKLEPVR